MNLHWTHGKELFDECDEDHKLILEEWKERSKKSRFYVNAIYVWTNLDVRKRKIVKKNKLNYLVFYSRDYHKKDGLKNIIETIKNF